MDHPPKQCKHPYHEKRPIPDGTVCRKDHTMKAHGWMGGVECPVCLCRIRKNRAVRHLKERCTKREMECDECKQKVLPASYMVSHGKNCLAKLQSCRFCGSKMTADDLCDHLVGCDELNKFLMERSGIDCSGVDKGLFYDGLVLMQTGGSLRRNYRETVSIRGWELLGVFEKSEMIEFGGELPKVNASFASRQYVPFRRTGALVRKLFYCAAMFGYDILDSADWTDGGYYISTRHYSRFYQYTYDRCSADMLDDLPFILGSDLTPTVLERYCHAHELGWDFKLGKEFNTASVGDIKFRFVGSAFQPPVLSPQFIKGLNECFEKGTHLSPDVIGVSAAYIV